MNSHTHMAGGLAAGLLVAHAFPAELWPITIAATLAGPLADIDHPNSVYGRFVPLPRIHVGGPNSGKVGFELPGGGKLWHRGPTHSLVMALAFSLAAALAFMAAGSHIFLWIGVGVLAGYLSHLALDLLNVAPISLWWPFMHKGVRIRTPNIPVGSWGEGFVFIVTLGLCLVLVRGVVLL